MARVLTITLNPALDLSIGLARLAPGEVNRASACRTTAAGKGNNVARVLAAHGHEVSVTGFLGAGNAAVFEAAFADWGVTDRFVRVAGETRTNVKLAEADSRVTDINAPGATVGDADVSRLADELAAIASAPPDAVLMAGSWPPGLTAPMLERALAPLREAGIPLWLDASGAALETGLALAPVLIKPNEAELAACVGRSLGCDAGLLAAGRELQGRGVAEVAISRGADGVLWLAGSDGLAARAPEVPVESTVCAGDTLVAGLMHGRLSGWTDARTLAFAVALSADAVTRIGVGRSDTPAFESLLRAVTVYPVAVEAAVE
ncbi:1-phosphofructokinase family hexose kinase [Salinisphaera hydrothermalis]|uniref:1-phosphofructokinase family hexose kinase n=1 Tax=Salinisphaera hydrothermalis TaxID=563188 RepID=UPI00333FC010